MQRREIWIIIGVLVLIGAIWTVHTMLDSTVEDTAPVQRSDQQNSGTSAPNEQVPSPGTNGTTNP
jgi:hypothetical protein